MTDSNDTSTLHMVQLQLDARHLAGLGNMLGLFKQNKRITTNYLVHCALGELFQDQAPKPFSVEDGPSDVTNGDGRYVRVLGYTDVDAETLHEVAKAFASPTVYQINDWDRLASKEMPGYFPEDMKLGFELQACPVIRKASAGQAETRNGTRTWCEGQELDAFLAHVWELDDPDADVDREVVYRQWLQRQFDVRGGASAESIGMNRFSIERMTRRNGSRKVETLKRPDVTLTGTLTVTDGPAFTELLKKGIGRHKSFGYGMLKVRRA